MVFWRFDDNGLIAERWSQFDFGSMFAQLEGPRRFHRVESETMPGILCPRTASSRQTEDDR